MAPLRVSFSVGSTVAGFDFGVDVPLYPLGPAKARDSGSGLEERGSDEVVLSLIRILKEDGTGERLAAGGENLNAGLACRWLKAKGNDAKVAEEAIRAHSFWRETYVPGGRISEAQVSQEIQAQKAFLQGHDNDGCALLIVMACRHDMGVRDIKETERFICYVLDNAAALAEQAPAGDGKIRVLFDLSNLRLKNLDVKGLSTIFDLLQGHYPERLSSLWFMNAPFIFWGAWRVVAPFINPNTRGKIRFINTSGDCSSLKEVVPLDVLPKCYGGDNELIPIELAAAAEASVQDIPEMAEGGEKKKTELLSRVRFWRTIPHGHNIKNWWMRRWRKWKNAANNRVTRALGGHVRSGFHSLRTRIGRSRVQALGQVPLRLIPRNRFAQPFGHHQKTPVTKIVVRMLVAELVILAIMGARSVVIHSWA